MASPNPYGRDDLMALAAFRYCLNRKTYIAGDCADWLIENWDSFSPRTRAIIRRELDEAFEQDAKAIRFADGREHKPLSMDCDRREWEWVRALWALDGLAETSEKLGGY